MKAVRGKHSMLLEDKLGTIQGLEAKLYLKEGAKPRFVQHAMSRLAIRRD